MELSDRVVGYLDSKTVDHWTRYVNGALSPEMVNLEVWQRDHQIYYGNCNQAIEPGEELLVWYGQEYVDEFITKN